MRFLIHLNQLLSNHVGCCSRFYLVIQDKWSINTYWALLIESPLSEAITLNLVTHEEMVELKLRIFKEMIKRRRWHSPKCENQLLKSQWTSASTYLFLYLLWSSSKFCAMSFISHLIMNGLLLFQSSIKYLHQLRHTSDLPWLCLCEGSCLSPSL